MFFFIDESGHTGTNLFDSAQPILYYGVLSSCFNLDQKAEKEILSLRDYFKVSRLHANDLGTGRILEKIEIFKELKEKYQINFDVHEIHKYDHSIISFFDQVFDSGMNSAVSWNTYWTPVRYLILEKLFYIFDIDLAKKAWQVRIEKNDQVVEETLVEICIELRKKCAFIDNFIIREIIEHGLDFATSSPSKINYNGGNPIEMSPNVVGFQFVLQGLKERIKNTNIPVSIIVDRQSEFNRSQVKLHELYIKISEIKMANVSTLPTLDIGYIPESPLVIKPGDQSIGLELVDIFLWIFKRHKSNKNIPKDLLDLIFEKNKPINNILSMDQIKLNWPTNEYLNRVTKNLTPKKFHEFEKMFPKKMHAISYALNKIPMVRDSKVIGG